MKRIMITVAGAAVLALALTGPAGAKVHRAKLQLRETKLGMILVNGRGFTVYAFTKDRRNKDNCNPKCKVAWPPVTTGAKPIAGHGVNAKLMGTIKLKSGVKQVTYAGHPLYTYVGDSHPAQTDFVNILQFGGRWPAVNAAGAEVK